MNLPNIIKCDDIFMTTIALLSCHENKVLTDSKFSYFGEDFVETCATFQSASIDLNHTRYLGQKIHSRAIPR